MNNPYSPPAAAQLPYPPAGYAGPNAGAVSDVAIEMLRQTRTWVRLMSVFCFIGAGLMLLLAIFMLIAGAAASAMSGAGASPIPMAVMGAVYLPLGGIYVYPGLKLWMYANAIGRLLASRASVDLESALEQQKSFWKYAGISTIVIIALYILVFVGAMAFGVMQGLGKV